MLGTSSSVPSARRRWATVSERVLRSVSACALPRPSATASAKLANSTVNQRNSATSPANTFSFVRRRPEVLEEEDVVSTLPTSDHEHHRVAHQVRGLSLTKLSPTARSQRSRVRRSLAVSLGASEWLPTQSRIFELLDDGAEREDGRKVRAATIDDHADHQHRRTAACRSGTSPPTAGTCCLRASDAGERQRRDDQEEAAEQHRDGRARCSCTRCSR